MPQAVGRDAPMMLPLLAHLRVPRTFGRLRTRPDRVLADKAYSSCAIRAHLRTPHRQRDPRARRPSWPTASASGHPAADRSPTTAPPTADATSSDSPSTASNTGAGWPPVRQARHRLPRLPRPRSRAALAHRLRRHVLDSGRLWRWAMLSRLRNRPGSPVDARKRWSLARESCPHASPAEFTRKRGPHTKQSRLTRSAQF
jgi:hypothetical protein